MIVQVVLLAAAFGLLIVGLGNHRTHATNAWKKIGLMLLVVGMIIAVVSPDSTNRVAHAVGVGRGADLLLYTLVIGFVFYALNNYLHQQDQRDALFRLARQVSLLDARSKYQQDLRSDSKKK